MQYGQRKLHASITDRRRSRSGRPRRSRAARQRRGCRHGVHAGSAACRRRFVQRHDLARMGDAIAARGEDLALLAVAVVVQQAAIEQLAAGTRARGRRCRCATDCRAARSRARPVRRRRRSAPAFPESAGYRRSTPRCRAGAGRRRYRASGGASGTRRAARRRARTTRTDRDHLERVPEVRAALGQRVGVVADALVQQRHHRRRHVQAHLAAPCVVEVTGDEQPLEAGDVVEVGMGDEQRAAARAP